jgi:hypothetical protein
MIQSDTQSTINHLIGMSDESDVAFSSFTASESRHRDLGTHSMPNSDLELVFTHRERISPLDDKTARTGKGIIAA